MIIVFKICLYFEISIACLCHAHARQITASSQKRDSEDLYALSGVNQQCGNILDFVKWTELFIHLVISTGVILLLPNVSTCFVKKKHTKKRTFNHLWCLFWVWLTLKQCWRVGGVFGHSDALCCQCGMFVVQHTGLTPVMQHSNSLLVSRPWMSLHLQSCNDGVSQNNHKYKCTHQTVRRFYLSIQRFAVSSSLPAEIDPSLSHAPLVTVAMSVKLSELA